MQVRIGAGIFEQKQKRRGLLARQCPAAQISGWIQSSNAATRLAAVLAAGFRLTLPENDVALAEGLPLTPWKNTHVDYADAKITLDKLGRMGTFTVAEHWKAAPHSPERSLCPSRRHG